MVTMAISIPLPLGINRPQSLYTAFLGWYNSSQKFVLYVKSLFNFIWSCKYKSSCQFHQELNYVYIFQLLQSINIVLYKYNHIIYYQYSDLHANS